MITRELLLRLAALVGVVGLSRVAVAVPLPACSQIVPSNATPLYVAGSSAALPLVAQLAAEFNAEAAVTSPMVVPTTVIYQPSGSCSGLKALLDDTGPVAGACAGAPCITGLAYYFPSSSPASAEPSLCTLDDEGDHVDVALSDVDSVACGAGVLGTTFSDTLGPVDAMELVTVDTQPVDAISAMQGYFTFGFTCGGEVQPWTDSTYRFVREPTSGTAILIEQALGLPPDAIHGEMPKDFSTQQQSGSEWVLASLLGIDTTQAAKTIGWLASSFVDSERPRSSNTSAPLHPLAFEATGQDGAYYPDSSADAFDKQNVRDGHYPLFGYLHIVTRLAQNGEPTPAAAGFFVNLFTGSSSFSDPSFDMFSATVDAHYVPQCAMTVQRRTDEPGADGYPQVTAYQDPSPCDCAFEVAASPSKQVPAGCTACTSDTSCMTDGDGKYFCNLGYCEAQ